MPAPDIAEGFYWVRFKDGEPEVAHRFAGCWFATGYQDDLPARSVEVLSARIEPPVTDQQGRAILAHLLPKAARGAVDRSTRRV